MAKFRYFELREFLRSSQHPDIDNTPTFEIVDNLSELTERLLDSLRAAYGHPIRVTSGYRCSRLNEAVGGVPDSAHLYGHAADLVPATGDFQDFALFVQRWLRKSGARFDQCIIESAGGDHWVHLALFDNHGRQRGRIFDL